MLQFSQANTIMTLTTCALQLLRATKAQFSTKPNRAFKDIVFLLCKSFCGASHSTAELQDLQHFVGDASGSMPVCYVKSFCKLSASIAEIQDLQHFVGDAAGSMPVCFRFPLTDSLSWRLGSLSGPLFTFIEAPVHFFHRKPPSHRHPRGKNKPLCPVFPALRSHLRWRGFLHHR